MTGVGIKDDFHHFAYPMRK